jgi:hypothetical protein
MARNQYAIVYRCRVRLSSEDRSSLVCARAIRVPASGDLRFALLLARRRDLSFSGATHQFLQEHCDTSCPEGGMAAQFTRIREESVFPITARHTCLDGTACRGICCRTSR